MIDPIVSTWIQLITRWAHVLGGVIWIGFLFFFALVQLQAFAAMGEARGAAARQLMPRGLWWFRWMAALTGVSGVVLLWLVYYAGGVAVRGDHENGTAGVIAALSCVALLIAIYDWIMAKVESDPVAHLLSVVLLALSYASFRTFADFDGRTVWIHVGSAMGIALLVNVWVRVWPAARDGVIAPLEAGDPPDPDAMKIISTRARRSVYVAVPLLLLMISNHYPILYGGSAHAVYFAILVAAGALIAMAFLRKASTLQAPETNVE